MAKKTIINLLVILACIGVIFLSGWIFSLLWNWLAPLFWAGAPELNLWHGMGIIAFLRFLVIWMTFKQVDNKWE